MKNKLLITGIGAFAIGALASPICPDHGSRPSGSITSIAGGAPPVTSTRRTPQGRSASSSSSSLSMSGSMS